MFLARSVRILVAAGLLMVGEVAYAQSLGGNPGIIGAPPPGAGNFGAVPASPGGAAAAPIDPALLGTFPEQLMTLLALTPAQRQKVDTAQAARKKMWADNQVTRRAEFDALTRELKKGAEFDPRAVVAMRQKSRVVMQERMDEVQNLWLEFWDSLDTTQRTKMVDYMAAQHERHGRIRRPGP